MGGHGDGHGGGFVSNLLDPVSGPFHDAGLREQLLFLAQYATLLVSSTSSGGTGSASAVVPNRGGRRLFDAVALSKAAEHATDKIGIAVRCMRWGTFLPVAQECLHDWRLMKQIDVLLAKLDAFGPHKAGERSDGSLLTTPPVTPSTACSTTPGPTSCTTQSNKHRDASDHLHGQDEENALPAVRAEAQHTLTSEFPEQAGIFRNDQALLVFTLRRLRQVMLCRLLAGLGDLFCVVLEHVKSLHELKLLPRHRLLTHHNIEMMEGISELGDLACSAFSAVGLLLRLWLINPANMEVVRNKNSRRRSTKKMFFDKNIMRHTCVSISEDERGLSSHQQLTLPLPTRSLGEQHSANEPSSQNSSKISGALDDADVEKHSLQHPGTTAEVEEEELEKRQLAQLQAQERGLRRCLRMEMVMHLLFLPTWWYWFTVSFRPAKPFPRLRVAAMCAVVAQMLRLYFERERKRLLDDADVATHAPIQIHESFLVQ
ncbi:unnamed protein product [Amoebophrya sp. A25]|nr:unnamed protein product [Amoebophrya sp. A25]|eukprot:GSA25T00014018001.1